MKQITFLGDSLARLRDFPADVRQDAGFQLDKLQRGRQPDDFKPMPVIGQGVEELRIVDESGAFRVIYYARRPESVYVLHTFQKKTQTTAKRDIDLAAKRYIDLMRATMTNQTFVSVFDAIADTPAQSASLQARAELMQQITDIIQANAWTQTEAAQHCGITQPRMNDLLNGKLSKFSLDALFNIAAALGRRVHITLEAA
ncbi:XRE family transcriptional regulator [Methylomicrobium lacus]|uniref:XRE family transcriptional regulator n=1 Tax=Methylomicrobium lacus TaxID=136992 RepID=UPI0035A90929